MSLLGCRLCTYCLHEPLASACAAAKCSVSGVKTRIQRTLAMSPSSSSSTHLRL